jgi:hypothetical protein
MFSHNMNNPQGNKSKHQHWVPQFYLNYFATPETRGTKGQQVWIVDKANGDREGKLTAVRNVCGKRYLYSPEDVNGQRDWSLDDKLNGIESDLGMIWPTLCGETPALTAPKLREALALFVAVTHLRNIEVYKLIDRAIEQRTKLYGELPEERIKPGGPDPTDAGRFFVQMLDQQTQKMTATFFEKSWSIAVAEEDTFITSDRPVGFVHRTHRSPGPGTEGALALFPISPRRLLVMDNLSSHPWKGYARLPPADAGLFNSALWRSAVRFAITGRPVRDVLAEIASDEQVSSHAER